MSIEANTGKVKFFNSVKGYGFITDHADGKEYFFHISGTLDKVVQDDEISFEIEKGNRGPKAVNIKRLPTLKPA